MVESDSTASGIEIDATERIHAYCCCSCSSKELNLSVVVVSWATAIAPEISRSCKNGTFARHIHLNARQSSSELSGIALWRVAILFGLEPIVLQYAHSNIWTVLHLVACTSDGEARLIYGSWQHCLCTCQLSSAVHFPGLGSCRSHTACNWRQSYARSVQTKYAIPTAPIPLTRP